MESVFVAQNDARMIGVFTSLEEADKGILTYHTKYYKDEFEKVHFDGLKEKVNWDTPDYFSGYIYYYNRHGEKEHLNRVSAELVPVDTPFNYRS